MTDFKISYTPHVAGAIVAAAAITAAHVALWPYRGTMHRLTAYAVGTLCIGAGITVKNLHTKDYDALLTFWAIVGAAGGMTGILHGLRSLNHARQRTAQEAVRHGVHERRYQ